jgi:hypothetical protein
MNKGLTIPDNTPLAYLTAGHLRRIIREVLAEQIHTQEPPDTDPLSNMMDAEGVIDYCKGMGINIPKSRIYKATSSGALRHDKFGRKLLFFEANVLDWIASCVPKPRDGSDAALLIAKDAGRKLGK